MDAFNSFEKGIQGLDLDYTLRDFRACSVLKNARLINKNGQGLIVTSIKGNTRYFAITTNYVPIGYAELNGIIYIVSAQYSVDGKIEIGTFPGVTDQGFVNEYKPLQNYVGTQGNTTRQDFNINQSIFGYDYESVLDVKLRKIYDGSVNIYICDGENDNIVINCGFDDNTGIFNTKLYDTSNLLTIAKQFLNVKSIPRLSTTFSSVVKEGGVLAPGNYFVFIRLLDKDFNSTPFIGHVGPISIFNGNSYSNYIGPTDEDKLEKTNKKISLKLSYIDDTYSFIEVALVRYFENIWENYLVNKQFTITSNTQTIDITGNESKNSITSDELLIESNLEKTCNSHVFLDNRYWGANWKSKKYNKDKFREFAKRIEPQYQTELVKSDSNTVSSTKLPFRSNDVDIVLNQRSYFRGEIYPLAVRFVFSDGSISNEAFPIMGYDAWDGSLTSSGKTANYKGIYRFPFYDNSENSYNDQAHHLFLKINFSTNNQGLGSASDYRSSNSEDFEDVDGLILVQGERIENMVYQGLLMKTSYGFKTSLNTYYFNSENFENAINIPITLPDSWGYNWWNKGYFRFRAINLFNSGESEFDSYAEYPNTDQDFGSDFTPLKAALFSLDYLFEENSKVSDGQKVYVKPLFKREDPSGGAEYQETVFKSFIDDSRYEPITYYMEKGPLSKGSSDSVLEATVYNIEENQFNKKGFTSYNRELWSIGNHTSLNHQKLKDYNQESCLFSRSLASTDDYQYIFSSNSYKSVPYLGLNIENAPYSYAYNQMIFAVFLNDPSTFFDQTVNSFEPTNTIYHRTNYISLNLFSSFNIKNGDCFIDRNIFRLYSWFEVNNDIDLLSEDNIISPGYGFTANFFAETRFNPSIRDIDDKKTFYPICLNEGISLKDFSGFGDYIYANSFIEESFKINYGYSKVNSLLGVFGNNENIPSKEIDKPNRIKYSDFINKSSINDPVRNILPNNYKDFDSDHGDIEKIVVYADHIFSINTDGIYQYFINQRQLQSTPDFGELVMGTGDIIAEKARLLQPFGSRHRLSVISSERAIYGIDYVRNIIWRIIVSENGITARAINKELLVDNWFLKQVRENEKTFDLYNIENDDNFPNKHELASGFNGKYNEVYFTFHNGIRSLTLCYNEDLSTLIEYDFLPDRYLSLNGLMLSYDRSKDASYIYQHNDVGNNLEFFGSSVNLELEFIVNGINEKAREMEKLFLALSLETNLTYVDVFKYFTEYQEGRYIHTNDNGKIWLSPVFHENKLEIPVQLQTQDGDENLCTLLIGTLTGTNEFSFTVAEGSFDLLPDDRYLSDKQYYLIDETGVDTTKYYIQEVIDSSSFIIEGSYTLASDLPSSVYVMKKGIETKDNEIDSDMRGPWMKIYLKHNQSNQFYIKNAFTKFIISKI